MDTPASFLETTINEKKIRDLLPGDPTVDIEAAYQLLYIFSHTHWPPFQHSLFQLVENALKKQYEAYLTGVDPTFLSDEDIKDLSLLGVLLFMRQVGKEAESITQAVDYAYHRLQGERKLMGEEFDTITKLNERMKEGDVFSGQVLSLLKRLAQEVRKVG